MADNWNFGGGSSSGGGGGGDNWNFGGGGKASPKGGGGGGILGSIEHAVESLPGSNVAANLVHGAEGAGNSLAESFWNIGKYSVHDVVHNPGSLAAGPLAPVLAQVIGPLTGGGEGQLTSKVAVPIKDQYYNKYGKQIYNHPLDLKSYQKTFWNAEHDPFGTFMDALALATVPFTAGGSAAIRAGDLSIEAERAAAIAKAAEIPNAAEKATALSKLGKLTPLEKAYATAKGARALRERSVTQIAGEEPLKYTIEPARTPWGKAIQSKAYDIRESGKTLPFGDTPIRDLPTIGANSRLVKLANTRAARVSSVYEGVAKQGQAAVKGLTNDEAFAQHLAAQGVPLDEEIAQKEAQFKADPTPQLQAYLDHLKSPGVRDALENPSKKMLAANQKLHDIAEEGSNDLIKMGELHPETHLLRTALPQRIAGGAKWVPEGEDIHIPAGPTETKTVQLHYESVPITEKGEFGGNYRPSGWGVRVKGDRGAPLGNFATKQQADQLAEKMSQPATIKVDGKPGVRTSEGEFVGGPNPVDVLAQTANRVNPAFAEPYRWPHVPAESDANTAGLHTSTTTTKAMSKADLKSLRHATGEAYRKGEYGFDPQQIMNDYLKTSRYKHILNIKENVLYPAARDLHEELPTGKHESEHYIRTGNPNARVPKFVRDQEAAMAELGKPGERIPASAAQKIEHDARNTVFTEKDMPQDVRDALKYKGVEGLKELGIKRINSTYAKRFRSDFGGIGPATRKLDRGIGWWKQLELYAKPAYAVHNIVQQGALFGIQNPTALKEMAQLVKNPELRRTLDEATPGLRESGFFGTQARGVRKGVYATEDAGKAARRLGIAPKILIDGIKAYPRLIRELNVRYAENLPKEAIALNRVKKMLKHVTDAGTPLDEAIRAADPAAMERVVDEALSMLGDWNAMTPFEKKYLGRLMPLAYPWFRTITAISGRMIFRYPGRIALLRAIGKTNPKGKPMPSWLKDAITLSSAQNGHQTMLETGALNPFATFSQESGAPVASNFNPVIQALITGVSGKDTFTGDDYYGLGSSFGTGYPHDPATSTSAQISRGLGSILNGLPEVSTGQQILGGVHVPGTNYAPIHHAYPSSLYTQQQRDAIYALLGIPIKHVNLAKAKQEAKAGR